MGSGWDGRHPEHTTDKHFYLTNLFCLHLSD